ncbi:hypothetical protein NPIL_295371 [Nephila pilipes]|uniref:Uncharacterized protein n=1 Tax=Nephila pilipes TaxID=299642 RepID=A0A8X6M9L1_NEPPI|nr:hypothetical protein NPIL_295371 [Nephila pilipes]
MPPSGSNSKTYPNHSGERFFRFPFIPLSNYFGVPFSLHPSPILFYPILVLHRSHLLDHRSSDHFFSSSFDSLAFLPSTPSRHSACQTTWS